MGRRIFIYHDGALGDLILSLPAIGAFRQPGDSIHLAGREDVVEFLKKIGYVLQGYRAGGQMFLPLFTGEPDRKTEEFLSGFGMIYVFSADRSSGIAAGFRALFPGARIIITIQPPGLGKHVSDFRLRQVAEKTEGAASASRLMIPPGRQGEARALLLKGGYDFRSPLVAIHPGSGSQHKCWPLEKFRELMKNLEERDSCFFLILSGPAESGEMKETIDECSRAREKTTLHVSHGDLATVASLLSLCHLYIGNDSGVTHLASSVMNGRVIALFGPTDARMWGPRGDDAVAITSDLECAPCETNGAGSGLARRSEDCGIKCLSGITVERVLAECQLPSREGGTMFCYHS